MAQALLKVHGRVQGVGFRYNARKEALALGLTGYAKNLPDDAVEILIAGDENKINKFIEWCHEGPRLAEVTKVEISQTAAQGASQKDFFVL